VTDHRVALQSLKSYQSGLFEMQDEGSQLLSMLVDPQPGETVLDACAGAGGKSLHLAAMMKNNGTLLVHDENTRKVDRAVARAKRAGVGIFKVVGAEELRSGFEGKIDRILIDAPCSGVGTFRRNPGLKMVVTEEFVRTRVELQRSVLTKCAGLTKRGGRLVYATCSLLREENEAIVSWFLETYPEYSLFPPQRALPGFDNGDSVTLFPHRTGTDGYFAAAFVRS
jgi:16S rRNA (cytosine967-C5)-methyltransferase